MNHKLSKMLMQKAGDGGGGGGAGGGSGDPPPALTADDVVKLIAEMLPKVVNGAVTAQIKRLNLDTSIAEAIAKALPPKDDDESTGGAPAAGAAGKAAGGAGGKLDPELERRIKAAERRAEDATKLLADEKAKREATEAKAKRQEERTALSTMLAEAKIRPGATGMAISHLSGRLVRDPDADDVIRWKGDDGALVDPKEGLAAYLKTPEGQELLPPRAAAGSGGGGAGAGHGGGSGGGVTDGQLMEHILGGG